MELYTLNQHNAACQLYLTTPGKQQCGELSRKKYSVNKADHKQIFTALK